jgi:hypothetical protein
MRVIFFLTALGMISAHAFADEPWRFKQEFLPHLVKAVPEILKSQDKSTGRFGTGIWIVTDQNVIWPLAVAFATEDPGNPHFKSPEVLEAIMSGGDALIADMDEQGMWEFRKKDGSTWGQIYMPWTYSRWIRAYGLIREAMPPERRAKWEAALIKGYTGIAKRELGGRALNIPAHHAMGLYHAGELFDKPEWREQAAKFLHRVVDEQDPAGFWTENFGPVVNYNFVYVDALGAYYAMSGDERMLPALERAARFHSLLIYPDGTWVETVDERNQYSSEIHIPNVGFTFSPEGRAYLKQQWERAQQRKKNVSADLAASMIVYGREGETPSDAAPVNHAVIGKDDAVVHRDGPWFVCVSAYHTPVVTNRWIQDRQNFVSLYHDDAGLIVGGGNTKLQPLWSTFSIGDPALLPNKLEEKPNFLPPEGLAHVPGSAKLDPKKLSLDLTVGQQSCNVRVELPDEGRARLVYSVTSLPSERVEAHVTILPRMGKRWATASGQKGKLGKDAFRLEPAEAGEWFELGACRFHIPAGASVVWPALPHNPYRKDGRAEPLEGRVVIVLPFSSDVREQAVTVEVLR